MLYSDCKRIIKSVKARLDFKWKVLPSIALLIRILAKKQVGFKWKVLAIIAFIRSVVVHPLFVRQISNANIKARCRHLGFLWRHCAVVYTLITRTRREWDAGLWSLETTMHCQCVKYPLHEDKTLLQRNSNLSNRAMTSQTGGRCVVLRVNIWRT